MTESSEQELEAKLGQTVVSLREDLQVSRHVFRGEVSYIVRDPVTFQTHRFSASDYQILMAITPGQSLAEILEGLQAKELLHAEDSELFYGFIVSLYQLSLLSLPLSNDALLYKRHEARKKAKRKQWMMSLFFLQIPVWNPNKFLDQTISWVRPLFSRAFFFAWLGLLSVASWLAVNNWGDLTEPLADAFSAGNVLILWATLIVLKMAHEFGHAYACKNYGGDVPEMGVFMIIMTPCAYVDATACWSFPRKLHRLVVCLAGMYVELTIASLALIVWSVTGPGLINSIAHNVVFLGSAVTVVLNLNPLMRFDGYYAFSDLFEIPNLRQRAASYTKSVLARLAVGVKQENTFGSRGHRLFLFVFGISSAIYKVGVVLGISAAIAIKYPLAGVSLAAMYILMELTRSLARLVRFLWAAQGSWLLKVRAASTGLLLLGAVPFGLMVLPVPVGAAAPGVFTTVGNTVVRAETDGFLQEIPVRRGQLVKHGETLARLHDLRTQGDLEEAQAGLALAEIELRAARAQGPAEMLQATERIRVDQDRADSLAEDVRRLQVDSPCSGLVVHCLDERDLGRYVRAGEPIATLASGEAIVRALLSDHEYARTRPELGQRVEVRSEVWPARTMHGVITRATPAASKTFDSHWFQFLGEAEVPTNPATGEALQSYVELTITLDEADNLQLPTGMTGAVRVAAEAEPLSKVLMRKILRFSQRLRGSS